MSPFFFVINYFIYNTTRSKRKISERGSKWPSPDQPFKRVLRKTPVAAPCCAAAPLGRGYPCSMGYAHTCVWRSGAQSGGIQKIGLPPEARFSPSENSCGCSMPADRSRDRPVCLLDGVCEQVPRSSGAHCPHFQTVINAIFFQSMLPMVQIFFFHTFPAALSLGPTQLGPYSTRALLN